LLLRSVFILAVVGAITTLCVTAPPVFAAQETKSQVQPTSHEPLAVVAYLPDYRMAGLTLDEEWLKSVTDLIYFSLQVPPDGAIPLDAINEQHVAKLAEIKEKLGCRLLLCLGGWERSEGFDQVARDPALRDALIRSLVALCQAHGFDGVDYDWEHPSNQQELDDYAALIEDTAAAFAEHNLMVTVAQGGWQDIGERAYNALDRVHLMCYDQDFPQATMAHAREEVARLVEWGCPPQKIALGIPFYGRNAQREARSYVELIGDSQVDPDSDEIDGYAFNGPNTVAAKTNFAIDQNLAGVMIWELAQDAPDDRSLLRVIQSAAMKRGLPASQATSEKEPVSFRIMAYNVEFGKNATAEEIGEAIKPYDLDIVTFNEVPGGDWTARVGEVLGMKHYYVGEISSANHKDKYK